MVIFLESLRHSIFAPEQQNIEISDLPLKLYLSKQDFALRNTRTNDILQEFLILIRSLRPNCLWDFINRENNYQYRSRSYDLGKTHWYQRGVAL